MALTVSGDVYQWGVLSNEWTVPQHADKKAILSLEPYTPRLVAREGIKIQVYLNQCLVITKSGGLLTWGCNVWQSLG